MLAHVSDGTVRTTLRFTVVVSILTSFDGTIIAHLAERTPLGTDGLHPSLLARVSAVG